MKQELDSEQIFERLDDMLRHSERKGRVPDGAPPKDVATNEVADLEHNHFEEVPRMMLTEEMMVSSPVSTAHVALSLEHLQLDEEQVEALVAQIYTDVNARIEASLNAWIDESLQKRVLEMTATRQRDPSLSH
ncbi:MAG: hypothetical protein Q9M09_04740 [Mariprofundaceae bacterium]|nr:hypothetical protein [Mariprofundaceae bacterium]